MYQSHEAFKGFKYPQRKNSTTQEFFLGNAAKMAATNIIKISAKGPASIRKLEEGELHKFEYGVSEKKVEPCNK